MSHTVDIEVTPGFSLSLVGTFLTVGEAAQASGLRGETIRYYERMGVLPPVPRSPNGYRAYSPAHVETLRFARSLRDLGLSPGAMASVVTLFHDGTCADMQGALAATIGEVLTSVERPWEGLAQTAAWLRELREAVLNVSGGEQPSGGPQPCDCVAEVSLDRRASSLQAGAGRDEPMPAARACRGRRMRSLSLPPPLRGPGGR